MKARIYDASTVELLQSTIDQNKNIVLREAEQYFSRIALAFAVGAAAVLCTFAVPAVVCVAAYRAWQR